MESTVESSVVQELMSVLPAVEVVDLSKLSSL